tara:strand:+ start:2738 stop:3238 length:501 start_codon:yes stop_codon:yes gene_type:complete
MCKMKLELKNITYYKQGSQETPCYNAIVYVDGKKMIDVGNDGHGGSDRQNSYGDYSWKEVDKVNSWIKDNFPKGSFQSGGETHYYDYDLESFCHDKLYDWLDSKTLKKDLTTKFLCQEDKELFAYKKPRGYDEDEFKSVLRNRHPKAKCLNFMPFEDALKLYKEYA